MTIIAGVEGDDGAALAADSFFGSTDNYTLVDSKIVRLAPKIYVGVAGSLRVAQVIRYHLKGHIRGPRHGQDPEDWGVRSLVVKLRGLWGKHGIPDKDYDGSWYGPTAIVAVNGSVLEMQPDWSISRPLDRFAACGAGDSLALGILAASIGRPAEERARMAAEYACRLSPYCKGPINQIWCPQ